MWHKLDADTTLWHYETAKITPLHKTLVVLNRAAKRCTLELQKVLRATN